MKYSHELFCQKLIEFKGNAGLAYLAAYPNSVSEGGNRTSASKLLKKEHIIKRIKELQEEDDSKIINNLTFKNETEEEYEFEKHFLINKKGEILEIRLSFDKNRLLIRSGNLLEHDIDAHKNAIYRRINIKNIKVVNEIHYIKREVPL